MVFDSVGLYSTGLCSAPVCWDRLGSMRLNIYVWLLFTCDVLHNFARSGWFRSSLFAFDMVNAREIGSESLRRTVWLHFWFFFASHTDRSPWSSIPPVTLQKRRQRSSQTPVIRSGSASLAMETLWLIWMSPSPPLLIHLNITTSLVEGRPHMWWVWGLV